MKINKQGIYDNILEQHYHADPCPEPSLSSSFIHTLLEKTPAHARLTHPRLNENYEDNFSKRTDFGSAAHDLILKDGENLQVIKAKSWRLDHIKGQRNMAYKTGRIPVITPEYEQITAMRDALFRQLRNHEDDRNAFVGGRTELVLIWYDEEFKVWCRARLDHVPNNGPFLYDYKTTDLDSPEAWITNQMYGSGKDIQAAWYLRGWEALTREQRHFKFIVQETTEPHCAYSVGIQSYELEVAREKVREALELYSWCLHNNQWPGWPSKTMWADIPAFADKRWTDRKMKNEVIKQMGYKNTAEFLLRMNEPIKETA